MKVYLAAWFASKPERMAQARELEEAGIEVTSSWLKETADPKVQMSELTVDYLQKTAEVDVHDINAADVLVMFTVDPETGVCHRRGGRHVEFGLGLGLGCELVVCGPIENIFHHLPHVKQFDSWEETRNYLIARNRN